MSNTYLLPHIVRMQPYVPGEQPETDGCIKLNTNENPYPPSPCVLDALRTAINSGLRLYPDAAALEIRQRLAALFCTDLQQILVGNGSDELLNLAVRCCVGAGDKVVYPWPTYGYYDKLVQMQQGSIVKVDSAADFLLPTHLPVEDARLTFIANPNSPSGLLAPVDAVASLAERSSGIIIVDEAYVDFSHGGCINLIKCHPNVLVVRTMSKSFSLAGLRIGFAFGASDIIAGLRKAKDHYNINTLSIVAAAAALDDIDTMRQHAERICNSRADLSDQLAKLGFTVSDSSANFVLARCPERDGSAVYAALRDRGILVRHFGEPRLRDHLRISVGTEAENGKLVLALTNILA